MLRLPGRFLVFALVAPLLFVLPPRSPAVAEPSAPDVEITRVSGPDRYATAAAVSRAVFDTAETVYIATGTNFADALAGGPRAALDNAPILLVTRDTVPRATATELRRLDPDEIVVLGGTAAVSAGVAGELRTYASVRRIAGADRFATAAALASGFAPGVASAYGATGQNFPDALTGSVAGGITGGPVLLLATDQLPASSADELGRLRPASAAVLGGTAAVTDDVVVAFEDASGAPGRRLAGADRIATAIEVSRDTFPDGFDVDVVYLATAFNFPDALAAAPAVAHGGDALLLTRPDCVPLAVRDEIARLTPDRIVVVGGTAAVSDAAAALTTCEPLPAPPTFTVVEQSGTDTLPAVGDSGPRQLAILTAPDGNRSRFVADEVLVMGRPSRVQAWLGDHGGTIIRTVSGFATLEDIHLVKLTEPEPPSDRERLGGRLQWLNSTATGTHTVSSTRALDTLVAATDGLADGLLVGVNFVAEAHELVDRTITESVSAPDRNPFTWTQFSDTDSPRIGTAEAWRLLALAGRDNARIPIAVIDGGFATTNGDYPDDVTGNDGIQNSMMCGDSPCPWHGTDVAIAAAGVMDNEFGSVGAAGPSGRLLLYRKVGGVDDMVAQLQSAWHDGARIVNMSFGGSVAAAATPWVSFGETVTEAMARTGVHLFASAGNTGIDVDATDCFGEICWESQWKWPCENDGVMCVGGLEHGTHNRFPLSNYGKESCGDAYCQVELFAPWTVRVGENPANPGDVWRAVSGTSVSSPYAAGVMAQMLAANWPNSSPYLERLVLLTTAYSSRDSRVSRVVNAYDAVRMMLAVGTGGNVEPWLRIDEPQPGDEVPYGGFNTMAFRASAHDVEDGDDRPVTWEVEHVASGTVSAVPGSEPDWMFPEVGLHYVRASVTDSGGRTASEQVIVKAVNEPPVAHIDDPVIDGTQYHQDVPVRIIGSATDVNEPTGPDCDGFTWYLDRNLLAKGCAPTVTFTQSPGSHTLGLVVVDQQGASARTSRTILIAEPPSTGPPVVSITSPSEGSSWDNAATVPLRASASDPDGDAMSYEWTAAYGSTTTVIATTLNLDWTPSDDVPFRCGGQSVRLEFRATASDGSSADAVDIFVSYPPC